MAIIIYHETYDAEESLDNFIDQFHNSQMKYFASDLLEAGLSPLDIQEALKRAMTIGRTSGLEIRQHFSPVYTQSKGQIIKDCKLSKLGYAMILMNARPDKIAVSDWQINVLKSYLEVAKKESQILR